MALPLTMKILFTGTALFTGTHFVRALADAGHHVAHLPEAARSLRRAPGPGPRPARGQGRPARHRLPLRRLHLPRLDPSGRFRRPGPSRGRRHQLQEPRLRHRRGPEQHQQPARCSGGFPAGWRPQVVISGSVFEGGEGSGSQGLPDFSPYGLSKALTARVFQYYCDRQGLSLGKFVIPNPFGPYEEPRFTAYLMKNWLAGNAPTVRAPPTSETTSTSRYWPRPTPSSSPTCPIPLASHD